MKHYFFFTLLAGIAFADITTTINIEVEPWPVPRGMLSMLLGCLAVYSILLGTGQLIYGYHWTGLGLFSLSTVCSIGLFKIWR